MKRIEYSVILKKKNLQTIRKIVETNGIIVYPTDTLYGLGGNFFSTIVNHKIDCLKNRRDLPYSVVVSGMPMIKKLVDDIPDIFYKLYRSLFPGKFTFLLPVSSSLKKSLLKNSKKIGIRIPKMSLMLKLVEILDVPFISTSVNRSGQEPINDPVLISTHFPEIDLLINKGLLKSSQGSTVLDLTETPVRCIRKGEDYDRIAEIGIQVVEDYPMVGL